MGAARALPVAGTLATILLLGTPALAAPSCDDLDEQGFRDLLLQLQAGIDRGDLELSREVVDSFQEQIPCLTFAPEPRRWADMLIGEAIVRFAEGEPWEPVMATALRIYPAVDRGVSSRHPLAAWEPPKTDMPSTTAAAGDGVYVDGLPQRDVPSDEEVHLVQRTDGRFWNSVRTGPGAPLPTGWTAEPVEQPARIISWGAFGLGLGIASVDQAPTFVSDWTPTIGAGTRTAPAIAAHAQGQATFFSPFGVYGRATAWTWSESPGIDAQIAGIGNWKALTIGAGFGTTSIEVFQGPETPVVLDDVEVGESRTIFLPRYATGMVHLRGGRDTRWHAGASLGFSGSTQRGVLEAHLAPSQDGGGRWRVGATLEWTRSRVQEQGRSQAAVEVGSVRSALHISRVFGEY